MRTVLWNPPGLCRLTLPRIKHGHVGLAGGSSLRLRRRSGRSVMGPYGLLRPRARTGIALTVPVVGFVAGEGSGANGTSRDMRAPWSFPWHRAAGNDACGRPYGRLAAAIILQPIGIAVASFRFGKAGQAAAADGCRLSRRGPACGRASPKAGAARICTADLCPRLPILQDRNDEGAASCA